MANCVPLIRFCGSESGLNTQPDTWGLVERIDGLPGVRPKSVGESPNGRVREFYVESDYSQNLRCQSPCLLCRVSDEGIFIQHMNSSDRTEVLEQQWGEYVAGAIRVFLPRDDIELDLVWRIVLLAYRYVTSTPDENRTHGDLMPILPSCSSTTRYWI